MNRSGKPDVMRIAKIAKVAAMCVTFAAIFAACSAPSVPLSIARIAGGAMRPASQPPPGNKILYVSDWGPPHRAYAYHWTPPVPPAPLAWPAKNLLFGAAFTQPEGECVDANGRTFVTDFSSGNTRGYLHGAVAVWHVFPYPGSGTGAAIGCAVDGAGNLAVSYYSTSGGPGEVAIWHGEAGTPAQYSNAHCYTMWSPGFDAIHNLFVEGQANGGGAVNVCLILVGSAFMTTVMLNGATITSPGGVMWDGRYIALTDQAVNAGTTTGIYQTQFSGGALNWHATTVLNDSCDVGNNAAVAQPFIVGTRNTPITTHQGSYVVGGNLACPAEFDVWDYPAGGAPVSTLAPAAGALHGQTVSFP